MTAGPLVNTKEATAGVGDVLNGKTFFSGDYHIKTGEMPNNGTWGSSVAMNSSIIIPAGYHNGSGRVSGPSITDRGAWSSSVSMNGTITIPEGYHNGSGKVVSTSVTISSGSGSNGVWTYDNSTTVTVSASFSGSPKHCYAYLNGVSGVRFYDNSVGSISIGSPWTSGNTAYVNVTGSKGTSGVAQQWSAGVTFIFIYY